MQLLIHLRVRDMKTCDSGRNLVLRSVGEITAARDTLGSEGSEKLAEVFARQNK